MEFRLIKDQPLTFGPPTRDHQLVGQLLQIVSNKRSAILTPDLPSICGFPSFSEDEDDLMTGEPTAAKRSRPGPPPPPPTMPPSEVGDLRLTVDLVTGSAVDMGQANAIGNSAKFSCTIVPHPTRIYSNSLTRVEEVFGACNMEFDMSLKLSDAPVPPARNFRGFMLQYGMVDRKRVPVIRFDWTLARAEVLKDFLDFWCKNTTYTGGSFSLTLRATERGMNRLRQLPVPGTLTPYRRMLQDKVLADTVLVAGDGTEIRCHKSILGVHSPVFYRMFETNMLEKETSTVHLKHMTATNIDAMLQYMYGGGLEGPNQSCIIAYHLLVASVEFQISSLETAMQNLMLKKDKEWFTVEGTLQLLQFALKKVENENNKAYRELVKKAMEALDKYPVADIVACPQMDGAFQEKGAAGGKSMYVLTLSKTKATT